MARRLAPSLLVLLLAAGILPAKAWQARIAATEGEATALLDLVRDLAERPSIDRAAIEALLPGTRFEETGRSEAFALFAAKDRPFGRWTLAEIDLREPVPGGTATAGPILVLRIAGPCLGRPAIESRLGPLTLTDVPRGHSLDETTVWSRDRPGRRLGFGFPERDPGCLRTVALSFDAPPG